MPATTPHTSTPVLVIGANPRAAALADRLHTVGHPVTTWQPTDDQPAPPSAPLVLMCAADATEEQRVLDQPHLAPHDLVNLTSSTSEQARTHARHLTARGTRYLQGALMAHPEHVGKPDTVLVYGGSPETYARHEHVLRHLGGATHLGPDPGTVPLYDVALLNLAWATLIGYLQTTALLHTADVTARATAPLLTHWLGTTVRDVITDYAGQLDDGTYPGDEEWLELDAPLMDELVRVTEQHGLDTGLPRLVQSMTARGIAAGHGRDSFASLVDVIRRR